SCNSNQSNLFEVTMSPALCGSTQTSAPSFTCQPGRTPSRLKLCQPEKLSPSNSSFQPAAFSALESVLIFCGSEVSEAHPATSMRPMASERIFFIMEIARHDGRSCRSVSISSWQLLRLGSGLPEMPQCLIDNQSANVSQPGHVGDLKQRPFPTVRLAPHDGGGGQALRGENVKHQQARAGC